MRDNENIREAGRQCDRVVRALDLKFGGLGFKSRSDRSASWSCFLVAAISTPRARL